LPNAGPQLLQDLSAIPVASLAAQGDEWMIKIMSPEPGRISRAEHARAQKSSARSISGFCATKSQAFLKPRASPFAGRSETDQQVTVALIAAAFVEQFSGSEIDHCFCDLVAVLGP
jgi:hypothetical protein